MGKRPYTRTGYIGKTAAVENQFAVTGFDGLGDALLKKIGVVRIDITGQVQHKATFDRIDLLQADFQAVIFFDVESVDDFVVGHFTPYEF